MLTVIPLLISNTFMTFAWYGHLRRRSAPRWEAVVRIGYGQLTGFQRKIIQECTTVEVFVAFACFYPGEALRWDYLVSFFCLLAAVGFGFWK